MKSFVALCACLALASHARAARAEAGDDFADVCHASSSYDLTVSPDALVFDRGSPSPRRIEWRGGALHVDGTRVVGQAYDANFQNGDPTPSGCTAEQ